MTQEQKPVKLTAEQVAKKQCSMCKRKCPHGKEGRHKCTCECKLSNIRGNCVHFVDKRDTFKRD